jgi:hypothetical protein
MMEFELELNHVAYLFAIFITWLVMAFLGSAMLKGAYSVLPEAIASFIVASYWIGGIGLILTIIIAAIAIFD